MVAVLLCGSVLAILNQSFLSPALPSIMADLSVDRTTAQWLTSGYSLVEAVVIPLSAYLLGRFSLRALFIGGMGIFTVGSLAAVVAPNFGVLLLGRILQAVACGITMPMVSTVILLVFPREKRGTAMGFIGLVVGFAPALGPSVSGLLVDSVGWRALFLIVVVLAVVVEVIACVFLKKFGNFQRITFDFPSVVLSALGLVSLLYGLSTFSSSTNYAATAAFLVVGIVLLAFFAHRQLKLEVPMLRVGILRTRQYATSVGVIMLIQAALMGTGVLMPLYIQDVRGLSATVSGLVMLPGAVIGAILGFIAGRLFDRVGARKLVLPGGIVVIAGALGLVTLWVDTGLAHIVLAYTLLAMGLQFITTPLNTWGVNSLPNDVIQHAQSLSNTMNQVAGATGTALLVSLSALAPYVFPTHPALEQACLGDRIAFCGTLVILAIAFVVMLALVHDKKRGGEETGDAHTGAAGSHGAGAASAHGASARRVEEDERHPQLDHAFSDLPESIEDLSVFDVMDHLPVSVPKTASMEDVLRILARTQTSGVPVLDDERNVVGFVSDGDVARCLGKSDVTFMDASLNIYRMVDEGTPQERLDDTMHLNVMDVATKRVVSVDEDMPFDQACHVLSEKRIKKVPVTRGGKLVGTLSRRNVVRALAAIMDERMADGADAADEADGSGGEAAVVIDGETAAAGEVGKSGAANEASPAGDK